MANARKRKMLEQDWKGYRAENPVDYKRLKGAENAAEKELGHAIRMTRHADF